MAQSDKLPEIKVLAMRETPFELLSAGDIFCDGITQGVLLKTAKHVPAGHVNPVNAYSLTTGNAYLFYDAHTVQRCSTAVKWA